MPERLYHQPARTQLGNAESARVVAPSAVDWRAFACFASVPLHWKRSTMPKHLPIDVLHQPFPRRSEEPQSNEIQSLLRELRRLRWQVRGLFAVIVACACIAPLGWVQAEARSMLDVDEITTDKITCTQLAVGNGKGSLILLNVTDEGAMISLHRKSDPKLRADDNYTSWSVDDFGGKASMKFTDEKQADRLAIKEEKSGKFGLYWKDGKGKQIKTLTD
jgi:hypothetical protein